MSCLVFLLLGFGLGGAVNGALRDSLAELRRQRAEAAQLEAEVVSIRSLLEQGEPALRRVRRREEAERAALLQHTRDGLPASR